MINFISIKQNIHQPTCCVEHPVVYIFIEVVH